jgi:hypothetical protein
MFPGSNSTEVYPSAPLALTGWCRTDICPTLSSIIHYNPSPSNDLFVRTIEATELPEVPEPAHRCLFRQIRNEIRGILGRIGRVLE